jgi:hypothetical protein
LTKTAPELNNKLNAFIEGILNNLQLRANIIKLVKDSLNRSGKNSESVEALYSIFTYTQTDQKLSQQQFRDILVEDVAESLIILPDLDTIEHQTL